jgi:Peptidase C13 family
MSAVAYYATALGRNIVAGTRLALFLRLRPFDYRVSALHFAVLMAFNFAVWIALAAVRLGFDRQFDPAALPSFFSDVALTLAASLFAALAYREPGRLLVIATALSASDLVFELAALVLPPPLVLAWTWIIALRALIVAAGWRRPQFFVASLAVTAVIALAIAVPHVDPWREADEETEGEPLVQERVFHLQGELMQRALDAIAPGRPGTRELYFVAFAPDASEDVFLAEARFVRRLFDERFGTAGRSIVLASSETALEEYPIGSATNLSRALERIGEAMNGDEDMLFLFITAHGDREHRLSAVQPPLELAPLTPTALARMLHDSGIKWRVLVISACYAGGFIEPLRDDNTVIIAAASADRTSFGCEPGRDFTYFGQAYFRDALAQTRSFGAAFEIAKAIVARQETEEGKEPSQPQIWIGPAIAARLKDF